MNALNIGKLEQIQEIKLSNIFKRIEGTHKLYNTKGASEKAIGKAESKLGIIFPDEYKDYLSRYGAVSFGSTELTGLNIDGYANVIDVTLNEINRNSNFPKDCFVLESLGVEGLLILMNTNGEVWEWKDGTCKRKYTSMEEYLTTKIK